VAHPRVLVLVLAGGAGGRLQPLTESRAKPAVRFGGHYRLIDVVLSNCLHSGLSDVWVVEQHNPATLAEHMANGRPWDLDRTVGGLLLLHPHLGDDREGWHSGTADALWRKATLVRDFAPEALVVLSADAVYALDYDDLVRRHLASEAAVTMVTTHVAEEDASRYGVVQAEDGRVVNYSYKPDEPSGTLVTNEVFVFDPAVLDLLEELAEQAGDEGLSDLGDELLPRLVREGRAREHRFEGYWRDVGTLDAYHAAHLELLGPEPPFDPGDQRWPLVTPTVRRPGARVRAGAQVEDSLLSPGCDVAGQVRRCVLSPGVVVEAGAQVEDTVLLDDVVVRAGARVRSAVLDVGVEVDGGADVGGRDEVQARTAS
jgi:glucose-1-phosphate adenylyltransferase